jgi:hypothetical protein
MGMIQKFRVVIFCLILGLSISVAKAQTGHSVTLYPIATDNFPVISTYFDVQDLAGNFIRGIQKDQVSVLEDQNPRSLSELVELQPGVQFAVVINGGKSFALQDSKGISLYEKIAEVLKNWSASRIDDNTDDLSLLTGTEIKIAHTSDMKSWAIALEAYNPDFRTLTANLDSISQGLDSLADPTPRAGMKRALLVVTPAPDDANLSSLQSLIERARQTGTKIFIWLVDSPFNFTTGGAKALQDLATQTGGQFFTFSGIESIPDPEQYLDNLRYVYSLNYDSKLNSSGVHQIAVQVKTADFTVTSNNQAVDLNIQPPNPIFLSPPMQITRTSSPDSDEPLESLSPTSQVIKILIEFPDGHPREIQRTTLYVDKTLVDENISPPFDQFTWDLTNYTESQRHILFVESVDNLGLSRVSMEIPVQVNIQLPPTGFLATLSSSSLVLAGIAVTLAGAILALVLIFGGKKNRESSTSLEPRYRQFDKDPVTQPVSIKLEPPSRPFTRMSTIAAGQTASSDNTITAYLMRLKEGDLSASGSSIAITRQELTFGRDPAKATFIINDPSIDDLHARLFQKETNEFYLLDMGSIAGTWVNYAPISKEGIQIKHGDLIHIGRVLFRFTLETPPEMHKPQVITDKDIL